MDIPDHRLYDVSRLLTIRDIHMDSLNISTSNNDLFSVPLERVQYFRYAKGAILQQFLEILPVGYYVGRVSVSNNKGTHFHHYAVCI
jgi:hypothetical protein